MSVSILYNYTADCFNCGTTENFESTDSSHIWTCIKCNKVNIWEQNPTYVEVDNDGPITMMIMMKDVVREAIKGKDYWMVTKM